MAEYLILIYGDEAALGKADAESFNVMMKGHQEFGERNAAANAAPVWKRSAGTLASERSTTACRVPGGE